MQSSSTRTATVMIWMAGKSELICPLHLVDTEGPRVSTCMVDLVS